MDQFSKEFKIQMLSQNSFRFTFQFRIYRPGCRRIVVACFCNINDIKNVSLLLGSEDYGKGETATLMFSLQGTGSTR